MESHVEWVLPTTASEVSARQLVCRAPSRTDMGQGTPCNRVDGRCNPLAYRRNESGSVTSPNDRNVKCYVR